MGAEPPLYICIILGISHSKAGRVCSKMPWCCVPFGCLKFVTCSCGVHDPCVSTQQPVTPEETHGAPQRRSLKKVQPVLSHRHGFLRLLRDPLCAMCQIFWYGSEVSFHFKKLNVRQTFSTYIILIASESGLTG